METEPCFNEQGGQNVSVSDRLVSGSGSTAAGHSSVGVIYEEVLTLDSA